MLGISTGTETVVLLESDPGVRRLINEMLVLAGYEVREALDSAHAVRLVEDGVHLADLLLADITIAGSDLMPRLAGQFPNLRVLLTCDRTGDQTVENVTAAGAHVLLKPVSPGALMATVREVLDRPLGQPTARGATAS